MNSRPLNYDPLKVVLEYLEPNLRFQLSIRCPSLRKTEKVAPLRLNYLEIGLDFVTINRTAYHLNVRKEYPDETISSDDDASPEFDMDEYGISEGYVPHPITPGDIDLGSSRNSTNRTERKCEWNLGIFEEALELKTQGNPDPEIEQLERGWQSGGFQLPPDDMNEEQVEDIRRECIRSLLRFHPESLQDRIEHLQDVLEPYHLRRNNILPPFTLKLELCIERVKGKKRFFYPYTIKLKEAAKRLNTFLFGGRPVIYTSCFCIPQTRFVIPLPVGFKIRSRMWHLPEDIAPFIDSLKTISDDASFPLKEIKLEVGGDFLADLNHEVVRNAELLTVRLHFQGQHFLPVLLLLNTRNTKICIMIQWEPPHVNDADLDEIQLFLDNPIKVGTSVSFGIKPWRV
uniref:F-box domain-containing protein n=1 Tax=Caenorhabditis tropicalis TaxID=1561998 RepID=A0A1I7T600_9PELO